MIDFRSQFRVLYRDFLVRLIDPEIVSTTGDPGKLFVQLAAVLAGFNFCVALFMLRQYAASTLSEDALRLATMGDQQFLAANTLAIVGMFAVLTWGAVFPDRRDTLVLGSLPVRPGTIFLARIAAVGTGLGVALLASNIFTGLSYPVVAPSDSVPRALAAYWITMAAAGMFAFCSLAAVQGLAAWMLPYHLFQRASTVLHLTAFFTLLGAYFLTPGGSLVAVTAPQNQGLVLYFPDYWFLGLYQRLNGPMHPVFDALAFRAMVAVAAAAGGTVLAYAFAYVRARRVVEEPDIAPADPWRLGAGLFRWMVSHLVRQPVAHAVVLFTARTLARSSQHRLILAAYLGVAGAISLAYAKGLIWADSALYAPMRRHMEIPRWHEPNVALMTTSLVFLVCAAWGARAVFQLPVALKSNWIFRVTAIHSPRSYFDGTRKALYLLAVLPVWCVAAAGYLAIWRPAPVIAHLVVLWLAAIIVVEWILRDFRKIPFTCSYLPGKSRPAATLAVRGILFLFLTDVGTRIELYSIHRRVRYFVLIALLVLIALSAQSRWRKFAASPAERVQFDDTELPDIAPLDLRRDGMWGSEHYVDAPKPERDRPWRRRAARFLLRAVAVLVVLLAVGTAYERIEGWRERRNLQRVGQPVDIGGRSLNVSCLGETGPTVLFESGGDGVGYWWVGIQREVTLFQSKNDPEEW